MGGVSVSITQRSRTTREPKLLGIFFYRDLTLYSCGDWLSCKVTLLRSEAGARGPEGRQLEGQLDEKQGKQKQLEPTHIGWGPQGWIATHASDFGGMDILQRSGPFMTGLETHTHLVQKLEKLKEDHGKGHCLLLTR